MIIIEGSYFKSVLKGAYGSGGASIHGGWSRGPTNPDSYRSWAEINEIFDRFQKKSFSGSGGRLKVKIASENPSFWLISLIVFHWIYNGKISAPDFETTYLRRKWKFLKSVKNLINFSPRSVGIQVFRSVGRRIWTWHLLSPMSPPLTGILK